MNNQIDRYRNDSSERLFKPNGDQWVAAGAIAVFIAAIWPLMLVIVGIGRFIGPVGAEKDAILKKREKEIRQAEEELGITP